MFNWNQNSSQKYKINHSAESYIESEQLQILTKLKLCFTKCASCSVQTKTDHYCLADLTIFISYKLNNWFKSPKVSTSRETQAVLCYVFMLAFLWWFLIFIQLTNQWDVKASVGGFPDNENYTLYSHNMSFMVQ